jgi:hypothetical protein
MDHQSKDVYYAHKMRHAIEHMIKREFFFSAWVLKCYNDKLRGRETRLRYFKEIKRKSSPYIKVNKLLQ